MPKLESSLRLSVLALVLALTGCGATEPYVYKKDEFNRSSKAFNVQPTDRESVDVCYGGWWSTDAQVLAIADTECARFGKTAFFADRELGTCPLMVPYKATYNCVAEGTVKPPTDGNQCR